jgi:hypothetical protein
MSNQNLTSMEKPTVYYTNVGMENSVNAIDARSVGAVCYYKVMSLPREYTSEEGVKELFDTKMKFGKVGEVKITEKKQYNMRLKTETVSYSSIFQIKEHYLNEAASMLYYQLSQTSGTVMVFPEFKMEWPNGDSMVHLSLKVCDSFPEDNVGNYYIEPLELNDDEWKSLYIPYIPETLSLENRQGKIEQFHPKQIKSFIQNDMRLGEVSRVDFVDRCDSNEVLSGKAAYIHFKHWYNNKNVEFLRSKLNQYDTFRQKGYYDGTKHRSFYVRDENGDKQVGYIVLKVNHKPIPDVVIEKNIQQLAAANEYLENELKKRDDRIKEMEEEEDGLRYDLDGMHIRNLGLERDVERLEDDKTELENEITQLKMKLEKQLAA